MVWEQGVLREGSLAVAVNFPQSLLKFRFVDSQGTKGGLCLHSGVWQVTILGSSLINWHKFFVDFLTEYWTDRGAF